jgi:putative (di)nucleoside polyphosphate hydrolase
MMFRAGAGALILNDNGQVLAFERKGIPGAWQLPQGGLDSGEEPMVAAYREVEEETGITSADLKLLDETPCLTVYELPPDYRKPHTGLGQVQYWYTFRFTGTEDVITLGDGKEFSAWRWMRIEELIERTIAFRKEVYRTLMQRFGTYLK